MKNPRAKDDQRRNLPSISGEEFTRRAQEDEPYNSLLLSPKFGTPLTTRQCMGLKEENSTGANQ